MSGNCISGNGTFLYFRRYFQSPKNQNLLYVSKKSFDQIFLKAFLDNSFHFFYKLNQTTLMVYKNIGVLNIFSTITYFRYFSYYFCFIIKLLTFSQIVIYLSKLFKIFYHKISTFNFIRISSKYTHFRKVYA